jgi:hypothetical protein
VDGPVGHVTGNPEFQRELAKWNALRFRPGLSEEGEHDELARDEDVRALKSSFARRHDVAPLAAPLLARADNLVDWFEHLEMGPGLGDPSPPDPKRPGAP